MKRFANRAVRLSVAAVGVFALGALATIAWRVSGRVRHELHPARERVPAPIGISPVESVAFRTTDGVDIQGWYVRPRNNALIILVHGYGAQRGQMLPEASALVRNGYGVLLFDLRGHGESGGDRTTLGALEQRDFESAVDFATTRPEVSRDRIGAVGFSIGAMLVAQVASRDARIRAVVLEGPYTSLDEMIRHEENRWGTFGEWIASTTLRHEGVNAGALSPAAVICRIAPRPVLIINGSADEDNPLAVARSLFSAACEPKELWVIPGAHHTAYAATAGPALGAKLVRFFDTHLLNTGKGVDLGWPRSQSVGGNTPVPLNKRRIP